LIVARLSGLGDLGAGKFTFAVDQGDNHAAADPALEGRLALNEQNSFVIKAVSEETAALLRCSVWIL
jgi:hypothetical protein